MKKLTSLLSALAMVGGMATATTVPAYSAPLAPVTIETGNANIDQVQYRRHWHGGGWNGNRGWYRDRGWGGRPYWRGGSGYWGGYRGYNYYRPGYRYYNGAWFPLAAFGTGLIIGNAFSAPPVYRYGGPVYRTGGSHVRWCYDRYRSYRAYDNSFQPYSGPRRQCVSPY